MPHDLCYPDWVGDHRECPFGWEFWMPFCPFTVPEDITFVTFVACVYSFLPVIVVLCIFFLGVVCCQAREICWLIFASLVSIPHALLKPVFEGRRPEGSCLLDCGMPSGHSGFAAGVFCVLLASFLEDPPPERIGRRGQVAALATLLLPIGWSRIALRDHSLAQVLVGSAIGVAGAGVWLVCIGPFFLAFISRALGQVTPASARAALGTNAANHRPAREPVLDMSLLELRNQNRFAVSVAAQAAQPAAGSSAPAAAATATAARAAPKKAGGAAGSERTWHALQEDSQDSAQDSQ